MHVPFCETKCGYCDFFSVAVKGRDTAPLVNRIKHALQVRMSNAPGPVRTIFCGGGTPTILPADQLAGLLDAIADAVTLNDVTEYTVEANPATVDAEKAGLLVRGGVSRVHIINGLERNTLLGEVFTNEGCGTLIVEKRDATEQSGS